MSYKIKANLKNEIIKKVRGRGGKFLYRAIWTTWTVAATEQDKMLRHQMRGQRQWAALWILNEQLCSVPRHWLRSLCTIMSLCDRTWLTGGWLIFVISHFYGNVLINTVTSDCVFAEGTQWVGQLKNNAIETWKTFNYRTENILMRQRVRDKMKRCRTYLSVSGSPRWWRSFQRTHSRCGSNSARRGVWVQQAPHFLQKQKTMNQLVILGDVFFLKSLL